MTVTLTITVAGQPNYALTAAPASLSIVQNGQASSSINSTIAGSFNSAVSLSASGMPNGVTAGFAPATLASPGSGNSVMTLAVNNSVPAGTYPVTVTGNGGGIQQKVTVALTVAPAGAQGLPAAFFVEPYSYTLQASFGTPPYNYQLVLGGLPPGLNLDHSGDITGAATAAGDSRSVCR